MKTYRPGLLVRHFWEFIWKFDLICDVWTESETSSLSFLSLLLKIVDFTFKDSGLDKLFQSLKDKQQIEDVWQELLWEEDLQGDGQHCEGATSGMCCYLEGTI